MKRRWRWARRLAKIVGWISLVTVAAVAVLLIEAWEGMGQQPGGAALAAAEASPNYRDGAFVNALPVQEDLWAATQKWFGGTAVVAPEAPVPIVHRTRAEFAQPPASGLRVTWLGHSSLLIEIGGKRFLTDPIYGERSSPSSWYGPTRWYPPPLPLAELPPIDAVIISHDHYDHLDVVAIKALAERTRFVVPLGVGAHLEYWGVDPGRIEVLDWWQTHRVDGVTITCTPARHFSGRSPTGRDSTLWAGWAFASADRRAFYSGDTGMDPVFATIGERLGPFDMTMLEVGAYDETWADVHLGPEQAVLAHQMLGGRLLLPVHWGMFDLAVHGWTEPAERVLVSAKAAGVTAVLPRPGESVDPGAALPTTRWWPEVPWQTAAEHRVISSGLSADLVSRVKP